MGDDESPGSAADSTTTRQMTVAFVNYDPQSAGNTATQSTRRTVRSHIARRQHQLAREVRAARTPAVSLPRLAPKGSPGGDVPLAGGVTPPECDGASNVSRDVRAESTTAGVTRGTDHGWRTPTDRPPTRKLLPKPRSANASKPERQPPQTLAIAAGKNVHGQSTAVARTPESDNVSFLPTFLAPPSSDRHMMFENMTSFMFENYGRRVWAQMGINKTDGEVWESTLRRLSDREPALLYSRMLFAAGTLKQLGLLAPEVCDWLYHASLTLVYEALAVESRRQSEALIVAISRLALFEGMFGNSEFAHTIHRPAQHRMIESRGGMANLHLPAISKHFLSWGDSLLAKQNRTESALTAKTAPHAFSRSESLNTLQAHFPLQYANLLSHRMPAAPPHVQCGFDQEISDMISEMPGK